MKIIRNNYNWLPIPWWGYRAINLFGVLVVRGYRKLRFNLINHEKIHTAQMKEMLYIPFYVVYILEYLIRVIAYGLRFIGRFFRDKDREFKLSLAYRKISFEVEAYRNEDDVLYLENRKRFAWIKYIKNGRN